MFVVSLRANCSRRPPTTDPHHYGGYKRSGLGIWSHSHVGDVLKNPVYVGLAYLNKRRFVRGEGQRWIRRLQPVEEWIEILVPPIIDVATFEAAQLQTERNRQLSARRMKRPYLLRGRWFTCERCGHTMIGSVSHGDRRYYRCATKTDKMPSQRCGGVIRVDAAEAQVWEAVMRLLHQPDLIRQEVERQHLQVDGQQEAMAAERESLQRALARCEQADAASDGER